MLAYREVPPPAHLRGIVRCFWTLRGDAGGEPDTILPDGRMELVYHLGDPFSEDRAGSRVAQEPAILAGDLRSAVTVVPSGHSDVFGVRFERGAAYRFFRQSMHELVGPALDLVDVGFAELLEPLRDCSDERRAAMLTDVLTRALLDPDPVVDSAIHHLQRTGGRARIAAIAKVIGISERGMERRFLRKIGVSRRYSDGFFASTRLPPQ